MANNQSITELTAIERQLDKLYATCNNLLMLANLASANGNPGQAQKLLADIPELQLQQFLLYREKSKIMVSSLDWKRMIARIEAVNAQIAADLKTLGNISKAIRETGKVIDAAAKVLAAL